jgi:outer membrane biosynthesis protein TonB
MSRRLLLAATAACCAFVLSGCPDPKPAQEPDPMPTSYGTDMPGEPPPEAPVAEPEAGAVRLSAAMLIGGEGMSDAASSAASAAFMKAFEDGLPHFRRCYARGLEKNAELSGQVDVRLVLDQSGNIYELKLTSAELDDPAMVECVVAAFRKLKYAPLADGQYFSVTAPVKFKPE